MSICLRRREFVAGLGGLGHDAPTKRPPKCEAALEQQWNCLLTSNWVARRGGAGGAVEQVSDYARIC
jgi:hypothetical protein